MWMEWQYEWLDCNLTRQQCGIAADGSQTRKSQTRSYFNAFVNREFGGKNWSALQHRQMTAGRRSDVLCRSAPPPRALQPRLPGSCGVDQPQPSTGSHEAPFCTSWQVLFSGSPRVARACSSCSYCTPLLCSQAQRFSLGKQCSK